MDDKKLCFVIGPIGSDESDERRRSFRVLKNIVEPAAEQCGYAALSAKDIPGSGIIMSDVIKYVVTAPLVIADLTGGNANVFYELALRHAVGRPVVQIIAKAEKIEFDVKQLRTLRFDIDDVIDNLSSKTETITKLIEYIQEAERNVPPFGTPVSAAGFEPWSESKTPEVSPATVKHMDDLREKLGEVTPAEAIPLMMKYIEDLKKDPNVKLLGKPIDDLDAACTLVERVPDNGFLSGTSSLQNEATDELDADERESYRTAVNRALENNVNYRKIICSSSDPTPLRREKWLKEFQDKANLIKTRKIKPDAFQLLHYPSPLSVDVLISQDHLGECVEMVAGFAGGTGHGGFHTIDKRMVLNWLEVYLEQKIMVVAEAHTKAVLDGSQKCRCLEFLQLLADARTAASLGTADG
jgi:hypothetical protein